MKLRYIPPPPGDDNGVAATATTTNLTTDDIPFTVRLISHQTFDKAPPSSQEKGISEGRLKFPAVYYHLQVSTKRSTSTTSSIDVYRRFSQFKWLYEQYVSTSSSSKSSSKSSSTHTSPLALPASRPFSAYHMSPTEEEKFVCGREKELSKFVNDLLSRTDAIQNPIVRAFFELDRLSLLTAPPCIDEATPAPEAVPSPPSSPLKKTSTESKPYFPFDVIVVTSPDNSAARAALAGTLQDVVKLLNNLYKEHTAASSLSSSQRSSSPVKQRSTSGGSVMSPEKHSTDPEERENKIEDETIEKDSTTGIFSSPRSPIDHNLSLKRQWSTASTSINSVGSFDGITSSGLSDALNEELDEDSEYLVSKSGILVLSTSDPFGARCGSGGGTLAALAYADAVYRRKHAKESESKSPSVLIIHAGGDSSRCPTQMALGKAWTSLPVYHPPLSLSNKTKSTSLGSKALDVPSLGDEHTMEEEDEHNLGTVEVSSPTLMILRLVRKVFYELPKGSVVVTAGDCLIALGGGDGENDAVLPKLSNLDESDGGGIVLGLAVPAPLKTAKNHGIFFVENDANHNSVDHASSSAHSVVKFLQKPSLQTLEQEVHNMGGQPTPQEAWIDTGVVVLLPKAACTFRALGGVSGIQSEQVSSPILRACTRAGLEDMYQEYLQTLDDENEDSELLMDVRTFGKQHALPVDLYSHIMLALPTSISSAEEDDLKLTYLSKMKHSLKVLEEEPERDTLSKLYNVLSKLQFQVFCCPQGQFLHLGTTRELLDMQVMGVCNSSPTTLSSEKKLEQSLMNKCRAFGQSCHLVSRSHSYCSADVVEFEDTTPVVVNTLFDVKKDSTSTTHNDVSSNICQIKVGSQCVLEHCHVRVLSNQTLEIGNNCLLSGLRGVVTTSTGSSTTTATNNNAEPKNNADENNHNADTFQNNNTMTLASGTMLQLTKLKPTWRSLLDLPSSSSRSELVLLRGNEHVVCLLHVDDNIKAKYPKDVTLYGLTLQEFLHKTSLTLDDLWPAEDKVEESKRTLWNARLHPVITLEDGIDSIVSYDETMGWISKLMQAKQEQGDTTTLTSDASLISKWKSMERLSLQQIRAVSDAFGEYSSRHELENFIRSKFDKSLSKISYTIKHRVRDQGCDVSPYIESFIGGDTKPLRQLWNHLEHVIFGNTAKEKYDCAARCFMVMASLLVDLSTKLQQGLKGGTTAAMSSDNTTTMDSSSSDNSHIIDKIERIRSAPYQRSVMPYCNAVQAACVDLSHGIRRTLKPSLRWNPSTGGSSSSLSSWESSVLAQVSVMETCATYLEQGASALTEVCVCRSEVALKRIKDVNVDSPPKKWSVASSPGRIDIMGGWSDTPPISYEHGGSVVGMAVVVDGVKPISARCRLTAGGSGGITLVTEARRASDGKLLHRDEVLIKKLKDLMDYRNPRSKACLLKAALICIGLVPRLYVLKDVQALEILEEPIQPFVDSFFATTNMGMELIATSLLPKGSGMGGSSLLGGCVLAAISHCAGVEIVREQSSLSVQEVSSDLSNNDPRDSLIYAVLMLEQLMTTGGGWQDQTNLIGGLKIARSKPNVIPLELQIEPLELSSDLISQFNQRLVLVYTGTPRLAKNLLQQVLRRWAQRTPEICSTMDSLVEGAEQAAVAVAGADGDDNSKIDHLAKLMLQYRTHKKCMIGNDEQAEPPAVTHLIDVLLQQNLIVGATILGAGGGGYLAMITSSEVKSCDLHGLAEDVLTSKSNPHPSTLQQIASMTWHSCAICCEGMSVFDSSENEEFSLEWHKVKE